MTQPLVFAGLGDVHGCLGQAARLVKRAEANTGHRLDFVLQVGDLEAHRHAQDLASMYAPFRHKRVGDFPMYLSGERTFPRPMYVIGGNHEPYSHLESIQGERLAPQIHYLGRVGTMLIEGLRISFLTGCYDEEVYRQGRPDQGQVRDEDWHVQHALACFNEWEVSELLALPRPHVLLVHQWPAGLVRPEDHEPGEPRHRRLRFGETGVPLIRHVVEQVGPQLVLCGHRHRRYAGTVPNRFGARTAVRCLDQVAAGDPAWSLFLFDGQRVQEVCR